MIDPALTGAGLPRGSSGPELALEPLLGLLDRALVGTGGEVLPAAVAHHERDVGPLPRLDALGRLSQRRMQDRAGGDPGEDAFGFEQLARTPNRVLRTDGVTRVDQALVVQLRHETFVE